MQRVSRAAQALGIYNPRYADTFRRLVLVASVVAATFMNVQIADAVTYTAASVALSDPRPSQTSVNYTFTGSSVTSTLIKCVKVIISTGSGVTNAPTGFSAASATVTAASSTLINSSATGWSLAKSDGTSSTGQNNILQYTNATGITPSTLTGATFILGGVTNSSVQDVSYTYRINTYNNTDCATSPVDSAIVFFTNTNGSQLSLTVDPSLTFTVSAIPSATGCDGTTTTAASTATTIPFGGLTSGSNGVVCQDLAAATNASGGYTIYARYTAKPTNALSQTIADLSGAPNTAPITFTGAGTEAYGYATNDATLGTGTANRFTNGGQKWAAMTTSNAEIGYEAAPVNTTHYTIGHQAGISTTTLAGIYSTTVIYTCTPIY